MNELRRWQGKINKRKEQRLEDNKWMGGKMDSSKNDATQMKFYNTHGIKNMAT